MNKVELTPNATNRRSFLKGAGMTGIGLASAAAIATKLSSPSQQVQAAGVTDVDILNFALNLEYLEAEYYCMAYQGMTLVQLGVISSADETGPTTGGMEIPELYSGQPQRSLIAGLRGNEVDHVLLLRQALGSLAVKKPQINLDALGYGFSGLSDFYKIARQLEEVGTSAYLGAAPLLTSKAYLATAGSILCTEAKHTGALRVACIQNNVISPAVDSIDVPPTAQRPFDAPNSGLTASRTTSQVLKIVYGGGSCSGGFYPQGMNGTIVCSS